MPMDRLSDQPVVARSLADAGAARVVAKRASADTLAPVLAGTLADGAHRTAAARLGEAVRARPGATEGADVLEGLFSRGAGVPGRPSARP
jgi:UDP:flavonoid glycosyltransferase YjiC (YdhE family)